MQTSDETETLAWVLHQLDLIRFARTRARVAQEAAARTQWGRVAQELETVLRDLLERHRHIASLAAVVARFEAETDADARAPSEASDDSSASAPHFARARRE